MPKINQTSYENGVKFQIFIKNISSAQILIDRIDFVLENYYEIESLKSNRPNVLAMKFGDAIKPHKLFIELYKENRTGWWYIQSDTNDKKDISQTSKNLLHLANEERFYLNIKPSEVEIIEGAVKLKETGVYNTSFSFVYENSKNEENVIVTPIISMYKSNLLK